MKNYMSSKQNIIKTEMSPKLISYQNWCVTKTEMLPNLKCHKNWSFTKTELSPKLKCPQNWNVTKTEMLPNIIMSSKIKIKIQEIGTKYLGLSVWLLEKRLFCANYWYKGCKTPCKIQPQLWNKPAAEAEGADPSQCYSTNRQTHQFSKIAVTLEPVMRFWCPLRFRIS